MTPALVARALSRSYVAGIPGCQVRVRVLQNVSLVLGTGERMLVVGGPGSGKSTLVLLLAGLRRPDAGEVRWCGCPYPRAEWWRHHAALPADLGRPRDRWPALVDLDHAPRAGDPWHAALAGAAARGVGWLAVAPREGALAAQADYVAELRDGCLLPLSGESRISRVAEPMDAALR